MPESAAWCVVVVRGGQELRFRNALVGLQAGYGAYVPLRRVTAPARRPPRWRTVLRPALVGYVLVVLPGPTSDRELGAVYPEAAARLLRREDGWPATAYPGEVERLRRAELAGVWDEDPRQVVLRLRRGDTLLVRRGLLAGKRVQVARVPRPGAAAGLFLLGRRKVTVPLELFLVEG